MFAITPDAIKGIITDFHDDMKRGLAGEDSSLRMLPTFVDRATGKEKGQFIALDLGGTNFRVLQVELDGKGRASLQHVGKYVIPGAVMSGTGEQLFNFIAQSIQKFMVTNDIGFHEKRKLGFTFSFPVKQTGIAKGTLITWTKDFTATGVVGKDVVELLRKSFGRYGIENIEISALANDTVGTMAAKSYEDPNCDVGIIFGTGTNACYREEIARIEKFGKSSQKSDHMIINTEWGNFNRLPVNEYDLKLDRGTNNPGKQKMEKMISGMYLGEIARLVISDMIAEKYVFTGSKAKFAKGNFKTSHMSLIEVDASEELLKIDDALEHAGIHNSTVAERWLLRKVCRIVSTRAARISAAAISAVVTWMDPELKKNHTIAIDGTLYERHPGFSKSILSTINEIHGADSRRIKLTRARDGSGTGVAIVAAVAGG